MPVDCTGRRLRPLHETACLAAVCSLHWTAVAGAFGGVRVSAEARDGPSEPPGGGFRATKALLRDSVPSLERNRRRPRHSMKPVVLHLSDPRVAALVTDVPTMQRWEILRRSELTMTVDQLASACRTSRAVAQETLDRLVDAGFAVRMRVTAARRSISYRSASERVVIEYDSRSASDRAVVEASTQAYAEHARRAIDRARSAPAIRAKSLNWVDGVLSQTLSREDAREVARLLADTLRRIDAIESRAQERARAGPTSEKQGASRSYIVQLVLQPLEEPELPMPVYTLWSSQGAEKHLERHAASPETVLSPRELEVARRLSAGESRLEIAAALKLSGHTITTLTKRIYAKLGVHSRAELVARVLNA